MRPRALKIIPAILVAAALGPVRAEGEDDDARGSKEAMAAARTRVANLEADRVQLEREMIGSWEGLARDFARLKGDRGDALRKTLDNLVEGMLRDTVREGAAFEDRLARAIRERVNSGDHLSPAVSNLYSQRVAQILATDTDVTGREASQLALEELIPLDSDVDRIWDRRFVDHPTVRAWRNVNVDLDEARLDLQLAEEGRALGESSPHGMRLVPGGHCRVGPHTGWRVGRRTDTGRAKVAGFYIDRYEVTNDDYAAFLRSVPEEERSELRPAGWNPSPPWFPAERELYPVTGVTMAQAMRYAESVGKRLPTEIEWEKAARGEEGALWPWGNTFDASKLVWGGGGATGPARILSVEGDCSPYDVFDLAGNVAEMVATLADERRTTLERPPEDAEQYIIRGGSFATEAKDSDKTRTTFRWVLMGSETRPWVGFRCAMDARAWKPKR